MIFEPKELPTYIITSSNWTMEVPMDDYNSQFDINAQVMEAATRAIEVFRGIKYEGLQITMQPECQNEEPFLGTTILVHPKGSSSENAAVVFTHVCLANMGLYKDSNELEKILEGQMKQILDEEQKEKEHKNKISNELKKLNSSKKSRKKKSPPANPE